MVRKPRPKVILKSINHAHSLLILPIQGKIRSLGTKNKPMNTKYRDKILEKIKPYTDELNEKDYSHDINHLFRVENTAKRIAQDEGADLEIIETASLMFDIARDLEDRGEVEDHAVAGAEIARKVLTEIDFPKGKIEPVCHAIISHRRSKNRKPKTIEAKILQDADYLDAMGAVDIPRVIASALQSKKYRKPIFIDKPYEDGDDPNLSALHFLQHKLHHPKHQPDNFHTRLGKKMAKDRFEFTKEFVERFIDEWHGNK